MEGLGAAPEEVHVAHCTRHGAHELHARVLYLALHVLGYEFHLPNDGEELHVHGRSSPVELLELRIHPLCRGHLAQIVCGRHRSRTMAAVTA